MSIEQPVVLIVGKAEVPEACPFRPRRTYPADYGRPLTEVVDAKRTPGTLVAHGLRSEAIQAASDEPDSDAPA